MKNRKSIALVKLSALALMITAATAAAIAGLLLYRGSFDIRRFSDWLFYAAIAYAVVGAVPLYDVITSSNSASFTYGEYAVKGKIDNQDRVNDAMTKKSWRFSKLMIFVSGLLFIGAFAVDKLF